MNREFKTFVKRVNDYSTSISEKNLMKAFDYAHKVYEPHKRFSGDPVISHVLETAKILSSLKVDEETLIAAILHEVPKYTDITIKDIGKKFGHDIAVLVSAFEKIGAVRASMNENEIETLRKMFLVMAKDLRVVLIKLADRLHNMQTLEFVKPEKRKRIASETLDVYVPIASRLGVYRLRSALEDLCFKNLNEREYRNIQDQLKVLGKKRKNVINEIASVVDDFLKENNYQANVAGRFKNNYSIYKKLKKKGKSSIEDIHDIFALRVILPSKFEKKTGNEIVTDLYNLIGKIHTHWKPLPGRFKDYVGFPKPNGYMSLHTTVMGLAPHSLREPVEIQIRTEKMHEEAEYGIASHWLYKESKGNAINDKQAAHMEWIDSLTKISSHFDQEKENGEEIMNDLKVDLFQDRIFVFTPKGDVRDLPHGSTPIDYAYSIHSDLGHKCVMAKVNGSIVPLTYSLQNGEIVEVITKSDSKPKLEWLTFVKTDAARNKIKTFFRSFDQDQNLREGKEFLNNKLAQFGKPQLDPKFSILKHYNDRVLSRKEREELVRLVGSGSILASTALRKVFSHEELIGKPDKKKSVDVVSARIKESEIGKHIIVGGEKGLPVKITKCCKPSFGQPIAGFITRGRAISIHKKKCLILAKSNEERHIDAIWIGAPNDAALRQVHLSLTTEPNTSIMRAINKSIDSSGCAITQFFIKKETSKYFIWDINLEIENFDQFENILNRIENTGGVHSVKKIT